LFVFEISNEILRPESLVYFGSLHMFVVFEILNEILNEILRPESFVSFFFSLHLFVFEISNEILRPEGCSYFRSQMRSWDLKLYLVSFSLGACSYLRS
jgi:hypothetical protein